MTKNDPALFLSPVPLKNTSAHDIHRGHRNRWAAASSLSSPAICCLPPFRTRVSKANPDDGELHPVLQVMKKRRETGSKPGARDDDHVLALCIEGGGMRGAVAAGMVSAIQYCGFRDTVDLVYGSSAGAIVGAYFISDQIPLFGSRIYYDLICAPNRQRVPFIQPLALLTGHRPVLLLDRLVDQIIKDDAPLDWYKFQNANQPLYPVATSLKNNHCAVPLHFSDFASLQNALRASARIPGITGDPVSIQTGSSDDLFADAIFTDGTSWRSAIEHGGATHVLALRTRRHDAKLPKKPGVYEKLIAPRSLRRVAKVHDYDHASMISRLQTGQHIKQYAEDVRCLTKSDQTGFHGLSSILSIMPHASHQRIGQLEREPSKIFFAVRCHIILVPLLTFAVGFH